VLHYDSDYDHIAAITGQPMQCVIPRNHPLTLLCASRPPPGAPATAARTTQPALTPDSAADRAVGTGHVDRRQSPHIHRNRT